MGVVRPCQTVFVVFSRREGFWDRPVVDVHPAGRDSVVKLVFPRGPVVVHGACEQQEVGFSYRTVFST